ncbi:hypothetical protein D1BOALGB6SA_8776 [Olavius sp. associated proteobacterium Delta 1]|nr:hypothetical protein D1BOALGB6SA_8776 [Olavius sp. associated proteobacterium Delta 1]CAD7840137.1 MAG: hypothetical protein [Olavius algarvensis spirochete endosymbiont]
MSKDGIAVLRLFFKLCKVEVFFRPKWPPHRPVALLTSDT